MTVQKLRSTVAPVLRPARGGLRPLAAMRWRVRFLRDGIEGIAMELRATPNAHVAILRQFGAAVGRDCSIVAPLHLVNADGDFSNLVIGDRVHLGSGVLIDLADRVTIDDEVTLSMGCSLVTHIDVGPGPLRERHPRETGPVRIGAGAYLGAGATVLHGATVGAQAVLGAHALVNRDVPPGATVVAPLATPLATHG